MGISPVGGQSNIPQIPQDEVVSVAGQMQTQLSNLVQQLNDLATNQSQANNSDFLQQMASTVNALNQCVNQALNLRR